MEDCGKREFKGVWFPANVWLDNRLTAVEKIILLEIDSLDGEDGCYASNEYLAEFCQCSQRKVSDAISKLKKLNYVTVESFNGRTRILHACIAESASAPSKNCEAPSQNLRQRILIESTSKNTKEDICKTPRKRAMKTPTREEVKAYVSEKGYHFDPDHFYDYYDSSNWHLQGGKKVSNWKQCCVTWERNAKKSPQRSGQTRQRSVDFEKKVTEYEEPRVGSMRYDNVTGVSETYQGNGVWVQTQEGDDFEDIDF